MEFWISWKKPRSVFRVISDKREIDIRRSYESDEIRYSGSEKNKDFLNRFLKKCSECKLQQFCCLLQHQNTYAQISSTYAQISNNKPNFNPPTLSPPSLNALQWCFSYSFENKRLVFLIRVVFLRILADFLDLMKWFHVIHWSQLSIYWQKFQSQNL